MKFGHFDDEAREYVITTPDTPLPWINYLGTDGFFSLISNTCGGYSFYKDAKLLRITRYRYNTLPIDSNGKYYYIKVTDCMEVLLVAKGDKVTVEFEKSDETFIPALSVER